MFIIDFQTSVTVAVLLESICWVLSAEDRWIWPSNSYRQNLEALDEPQVDSYGRVLASTPVKFQSKKYEVTELELDERPPRPVNIFQRPDLQDGEEFQASYDRPYYTPNPQNVNRPSYSGNYGGSSGIYRPGAGLVKPSGIIDSYQNENKYGHVQKRFENQRQPNLDRCKCTQSFNCPVPGVVFGSCDAGKQYCCFSSRNGKSPSDPIIHDPSLGVLVGPGGPTGIVGRPSKGLNPDRNIYDPREGVLVGPGGPTGIVGPGNRPGISRPGTSSLVHNNGNVYDPSLGVLVGPGGPTGRVGPPLRQRQRDKNSGYYQHQNSPVDRLVDGVVGAFADAIFGTGNDYDY